MLMVGAGSVIVLIMFALASASRRYFLWESPAGSRAVFRMMNGFYSAILFFVMIVMS